MLASVDIVKHFRGISNVNVNTKHLMEKLKHLMNAKTTPNCDFKQLKRKEQECEELYKQVKILTMQLENFNEKLLRNKAIIEFADCPYYSYGDNTIEPTCTKNFCYDVKSCDHKNMVKYKQVLDEIEEYINSFPDFVKEADKIILNIINKAKEK